VSHSPPQDHRRWIVAAVVSGLACLLLFHFTMVLLYNSRPNPIKLRHYRFIAAYMTPVFAQDWHLFSPNPIAFDVILLIKTRLRDRTTGRLHETEWVDITTPIIRQLHRRRLSSLGSLAHIHVYTVFGERIPPAEAEVYRLLCARVETHPLCQGELTASMKRSAALAARLRARVASAHASKLYGRSSEILEIKVRTMTRRVPRFSERRRPDRTGPIVYLETEWLPYEPTATFS